MFKKGTLEVWLAVGDAAAPVNFFQRVLQSLCDTVLICKPCLEQKNWCGYQKFDIGKYPMRYWKIQNGLDNQYCALNLAEQLSLSCRILYYKMLKLEHRGKGLSGAVVNLRTTLAEDVVKLLPRDDALKYITATLIGEKVNKARKGSMKHVAWSTSKKIHGLSIDVDK